jgi:hypothetical protein
MRKPALLAAVALLAIAGCNERTVPIPPPVTAPGGAQPNVSRIRDSGTIHNADATRVWYVETGADQRDRIIMCDVATLQAHAVLCVRWPN